MKKFLKHSLYITLLMFAAAYATVIIAGNPPESVDAPSDKLIFPASDFLEAVGGSQTDGLTITQRDINGAVVGVRVGSKALTYVELKRLLDLPWDRFDIHIEDGGVVFTEK